MYPQLPLTQLPSCLQVLSNRCHQGFLLVPMLHAHVHSQQEHAQIVVDLRKPYENWLIALPKLSRVGTDDEPRQLTLKPMEV